MAKTSEAPRQQYLDRTKFCQENIDLYLKREAMMADAFKREEDEGIPLKRLILADDMLNLASNYIVLSEASLSAMNIRNEDALNEGRKTLNKAILYLEEVVSGFVDVPYTDYEDRLDAIVSVDAVRRYLLVRKLGFAVDLLESAYGANTKWKWSFVELEGRYAAVTKNILDLKAAAANTDPRSPYYEPVMRHLLLVKKLLMKAASRYRSKYELSTNQIDDFKMGIHFLGAMRRIHIILSENQEANGIKKTLDTWTAKLEGDIKKQDELKKRNTEG